MTRRCDSNPAQYERNRRFGHLVYVLGRSAGGAKLPSVGLCLNASKAESRLVTATIPLDPSFCSGKDSLRTPARSREPWRTAQSAVRLSRSLTWQGGGPKSSVDDLCTGRGVVLGRAATTLRSIETQPFSTGWFVLSARQVVRLKKEKSLFFFFSDRQGLSLKRRRKKSIVWREIISFFTLVFFFSLFSVWLLLVAFFMCAYFLEPSASGRIPFEKILQVSKPSASGRFHENFLQVSIPSASGRFHENFFTSV